MAVAGLRATMRGQLGNIISLSLVHGTCVCRLSAPFRRKFLMSILHESNKPHIIFLDLNLCFTREKS